MILHFERLLQHFSIGLDEPRLEKVYDLPYLIVNYFSLQINEIIRHGGPGGPGCQCPFWALQIQQKWVSGSFEYGVNYELVDYPVCTLGKWQK